MILYKIEQEILECIDAETGEIIDLERLKQLSVDKQIKIDNIACWIKQLQAETGAIEAEIKALEVRRKSKERKADSLKQYLTDTLCGAKFESARSKITWRTSDEVAITNESLIPTDYKSERLEVKVNKVEIKRAIKAGAVIAGAELVYKRNIQIS